MAGSRIVWILALSIWKCTALEHASPEIPRDLQEYNHFALRIAEYHALPWQDWAKDHFYPREAYERQMGFSDNDADDEDDMEPTRTLPEDKVKHLLPRSTYTFSCPTSVQCINGGCCPVGDYCAIRNGQYGCCPIGSECDNMPIPGCATSCFGICCDLVNGLIGQPSCSPTPGLGGQASGLCIGIAPSSPLYTPPTSCPANQFLCGANCCSSNAGLVCDNVTIPGSPFCNVPANVCPPGSAKVKRAGSTTDACLATTDTAAFASEISPTTSATTGLMTVSMSMTSAGASSGPAGSTHGTASTTSGGSSTSPSGSASAAQFTGGARRQYHVNGDIIWVMIGLGVTLVLGIGSLVLIV